jgi:hypothetical protein
MVDARAVEEQERQAKIKALVNDVRGNASENLQRLAREHANLDEPSTPRPPQQVIHRSSLGNAGFSPDTPLQERLDAIRNRVAVGPDEPTQVLPRVGARAQLPTSDPRAEAALRSRPGGQINFGQPVNEFGHQFRQLVQDRMEKVSALASRLPGRGALQARRQPVPGEETFTPGVLVNRGKTPPKTFTEKSLGEPAKDASEAALKAGGAAAVGAVRRGPTGAVAGATASVLKSVAGEVERSGEAASSRQDFNMNVEKE